MSPLLLRTLAVAITTAFTAILVSQNSVTALAPYTLENDAKNVFIAEPLRDAGPLIVCDFTGGVGIITSTDPGENAEAVWRFFAAQGVSAPIIAGIIGNMHHESGVQPQRLESVFDRFVPAEQVPEEAARVAAARNGSVERVGWGLVQWTPARKFIDNANGDPNDINVQLAYLWGQLNGDDSVPSAYHEVSAGRALLETTTIEQATRVFAEKYERPAADALRSSIDKRVQAANGAFERFASNIPVDEGGGGFIPSASGGGTTPTSAGCSNGGTPRVVSAGALNFDDILKSGSEFNAAFPDGNPADFISWTLNQAGQGLTGGEEGWRYSSVTAMKELYETNPAYEYQSAENGLPQIGDTVFFIDAERGIEYVGIISNVSGNQIAYIALKPDGTVAVSTQNATPGVNGLVGYGRRNTSYVDPGIGGGNFTASNGNIKVIGDSLVHQVGTSEKLLPILLEDGWQSITINARGCRAAAGQPNACNAADIPSFDAILEQVENKTFNNGGQVQIGDVNTGIRDSTTIVVALGTNDKPVSTSVFAGKVRKIVGQIRELNNGAQIYWVLGCTKEYAAASGNANNPALRQVHEELDIKLIDWESKCPGDGFSDGLHYNEKGAQAYAETIAAEVKDSLISGVANAGPVHPNYGANLAMLKSVSYRNRNLDNSPFRNVPSAQLPLDGGPLFGPRSEYLNNPGGNPEQSFPVSSGGQFRTSCEFSHFAYDDPIIFPDQPGKAHLHMFFGNTDANAHSTYNSIINSGSGTCNGMELNRTGYWVPAMFDSRGNVRVPERIVVYYKGEGLARGNSVVYPEGAAILAHTDPHTISDQLGGHPWKNTYVCSDQYSSPSANGSDTMPNCSGNPRYGNERMVLEMNVKFPQCWNGGNPAAYRDSYSLPRYDWYGSNCPVKTLPNMEYFVNYYIEPGENTSGWYLSSDVDKNSFNINRRGAGTHGDWWGGWNKQVNQRFIDNCVNRAIGTPSGCGFGYLTDGGPNSSNPYPGPALKYRQQYTGPHKIPAQQIYNDLCNSTRPFVRTESAAYCTP